MVEIKIRDQNTDLQDKPDPELELEPEPDDDDTIHGLDRTKNLTNNESLTSDVVQENESQAQEHATHDKKKTNHKPKNMQPKIRYPLAVTLNRVFPSEVLKEFQRSNTKLT